MTSTDQSASERLLKLKEAAELAGCSVKTLYRRNKGGGLPMIRHGRVVRIHPDDLQTFIRKHRSDSK